MERLAAGDPRPGLARGHRRGRRSAGSNSYLTRDSRWTAAPPEAGVGPWLGGRLGDVGRGGRALAGARPLASARMALGPSGIGGEGRSRKTEAQGRGRRGSVTPAARVSPRRSPTCFSGSPEATAGSPPARRLWRWRVCRFPATASAGGSREPLADLDEARSSRFDRSFRPTPRPTSRHGGARPSSCRSSPRARGRRRERTGTRRRGLWRCLEMDVTSRGPSRASRHRRATECLYPRQRLGAQAAFLGGDGAFRAARDREPTVRQAPSSSTRPTASWTSTPAWNGAQHALGRLARARRPRRAPPRPWPLALVRRRPLHHRAHRPQRPRRARADAPPRRHARRPPLRPPGGSLLAAGARGLWRLCARSVRSAQGIRPSTFAAASARERTCIFSYTCRTCVRTVSSEMNSRSAISR